MVEDLTAHLYAGNLLRYIEGYVQKVAPQKAPRVVGALLDCEAPDEFIHSLIISVRCVRRLFLALGLGFDGFEGWV